jgi:hypothetical protein
LADADVVRASDYLHSNLYTAGPQLQGALNRARRRRQSPPKVDRGGLSRREWERRRAAAPARLG